ncbi:MAG TPA: hypothetical protein VLX92_02965 [Kofleriaceae bacterium]|nr:hypothetical protein [Kofleriaceae bacterium]
MRLLAIPFSLGIALLGCGTDSPSENWVPNFHPPSKPSGFTRYITPTVTDITPGYNQEWCQWVAGPSDQAQDVLALAGYQSPTGHHAVLYATTETNFPVGESHICTTDDMLSISFLGGIGGEGTGGTNTLLPDGLYFRLEAGQAMMANTHWLNATDDTVEGQAVIDIKMAPESDQRTAADLLANNGDTFQINAGGMTSYDNSCLVKEDLNLAMVTNHMHQWGFSIYTEVIHTDGTTDMLRSDPAWSPEWAFNPQYTLYSLDVPKVVHAGETIHTHCEWMNTSANTLLFPDEMCDGIGFYFPGHGMITCEDGTWQN